MFSFDEIRGNEKIISSLRRAISAGRVSHAYIFSGQAGLGKKLIAGAFAKTLQCISMGDAPCGVCVSCRTFESGNHPDVFYVKASKTKSIGVDDVREQINARMETKPYRYPYKIFIVDKADTMTVAAQNAFLRTMEEPSSFGVFLLLCENHGRLLPTVKSRCVNFKLLPAGIEPVRARLALEPGVTAEQADMCAVYSQGNIGRALAYLNDAQFAEMREAMLRLALDTGTHPPAALFDLSKGLEAYKEHIDEALDILYMWYRDAVIAKKAPGAAALANSDKNRELERFSASYPLGALTDACGAVLLAKRRLTQNGNFQLVLDIMMMEITGLKKRPDANTKGEMIW